MKELSFQPVLDDGLELALEPLPYHLEDACPVPWSATQKAGLLGSGGGGGYPFDLESENTQSYVIRRYLEALWLPETISSLEIFIQSLRRIRHAPTPSSSSTTLPPHPLHELLKPLLLPPHYTSTKYRDELRQILVDGGGAGEQEECMMWFAWGKAKRDAVEEQAGDDDDEKWNRSWMDKLEKREVLIQILLHLLKLSLPDPWPTPTHTKTSSDAPKKRKRRKKTHEINQEENGEPEVQSASREEVEDNLERYMDKLSMWQLMISTSDLVSAGKSIGKGTERSWPVKFCEDVVGPLFKDSLPEKCKLLHTKLVPQSALSDDERTVNVPESPKSFGDVRALSRARSMSRSYSVSGSRSSTPFPGLFAASGSATAGEVPDAKLDSNATSRQRSLSTSLSLSLAQDEDEQRRNVVDGRKGRVMSREVSMSRVFKEKERKGISRSQSSTLLPGRHGILPIKVANSSASSNKPPGSLGVTLVAATPAKRARTSSVSVDAVLGTALVDTHQPNSIDATNEIDIFGSSSTPARGSVLVVDTPVKQPPQQQRSSSTESLLDGPLTPVDDDDKLLYDNSLTPNGHSRDKGKRKAEPETMMQDHDEYEEDMFNDSFGSPDILLLGSGFDSPLSPLSNLGSRTGSSSGRSSGLGLRSRMSLSPDILDTPTRARVKKR